MHGNLKKACRAVPTLCHTSNRCVIQELLQLQGVNDAQRGAAFLCRLSESEYRRPLGFHRNMHTFHSQLYDGGPFFFSLGR